MSRLSEIIICPLCNKTLNTVSHDCDRCGNFSEQQLQLQNSSIDLTFKTNIDNKHLPTEIFRGFWIPFFYEKILPPIWALGLRGDGGIDRETEEVLEFFGSSLDIIVDLSCGTGIMARRLARSQKSPYIVAIDYSEAMLAVLQQEIIKELIPVDRFAIIRGDVEAIPLLDNSVDAIYCGAAMHCWENPDRAIDNIYRILRPGAKLYLTTFLQPLPSIVFNFFSTEELADIFTNAGFLKDSLEIVDRGIYGIVKCIKKV